MPRAQSFEIAMIWLALSGTPSSVNARTHSAEISRTRADSPRPQLADSEPAPEITVVAGLRSAARISGAREAEITTALEENLAHGLPVHQTLMDLLGALPVPALAQLDRDVAAQLTRLRADVGRSRERERRVHELFAQALAVSLPARAPERFCASRALLSDGDGRLFREAFGRWASRRDSFWREVNRDVPSSIRADGKSQLRPSDAHRAGLRALFRNYTRNALDHLAEGMMESPGSEVNAHGRQLRRAIDDAYAERPGTEPNADRGGERTVPGWLPVPMARQAGAMWCWAASIQNILAQKGVNVSQTEIVRFTFGVANRRQPSTDPAQVVRAIDHFGAASGIRTSSPDFTLHKNREALWRIVKEQHAKLAISYVTRPGHAHMVVVQDIDDRGNLIVSDPTEPGSAYPVSYDTLVKKMQWRFSIVVWP